MPNLFDFADYKSFLSLTLRQDRGSQSALARHIGCQAATLYQVLKGKGELTEDQSFKVTTYFEFSKLERDYFLGLVRFSKAGSAELRVFLAKENQATLEAHNDLKNRVQAEAPENDDEFWNYYFATSTPSFLHILTSSKNFQTVPALSRHLHLSEAEIEENLHKLEERGLVEFKNKRWSFAKSSLHFSKESRFNQQMQKSRRIECLNSMNECFRAESVHFSSLFTADPATILKLKAMIAEFVQESHLAVHAGGTDEAYVMNIDLFKV